MRFAVVGSGPAGFYAVESLLKETRGRVDILERLATPFGLVRSGVAPDHPEVKNVVNKFSDLAAHARCRFLGNVELGRTVSLDDLAQHYDGVVLACGAPDDRLLRIPGEAETAGVHAARSFVGWYNGHPDHAAERFDLAAVESVAVIGQGNVALDVARVLCTPLDDLRKTDITEYALDALASSRVRDVHVIGRRGPAQAAFTTAELRELTRLPGCSLRVDPADLDLDDASAHVVQAQRARKRQIDLLNKVAASAGAPAPDTPRQMHLRFFRSPQRIVGGAAMESLELMVNRLEGPPDQQRAVATGQTESLPAQMLLRSVGYLGVPVQGVPFDPDRRVVPNTAGRIRDGLYVTGWMKRGASGIIGTNRWDAQQTVRALLNDLDDPDSDRDTRPDLAAELHRRAVPVVDWSGWLRIDAQERRRGAALGKPREKITDRAALLELGVVGSRQDP